MQEPGASPPRELSELRMCIDSVDARLVELLNERALFVQEVGRRKALDGTPVFAPSREQAVLTRVLSLNRGPLLPGTRPGRAIMWCWPRPGRNLIAPARTAPLLVVQSP